MQKKPPGFPKREDFAKIISTCAAASKHMQPAGAARDRFSSASKDAIHHPYVQ
jgi:hypothetical protein